MPRLPSITQPTQDQSAAHAYLIKTRGPAGIKGGFGVMLASPDLCQRIAHVGSYIRFLSPVPKRLREVAATTISSELKNPWEYVIHAKICIELGVPEQEVQAILDCASVACKDIQDQIAVNIAREMARNHQLTQPTFDQAKALLGDAGVVDLIATVGYFSMLAVTHKALEVFPEST